MKRFTMKYSTLFLVPLLAFSMVTQTACSAAQFSNVVSQIQAQLPAAQAAAVTILNFTDPLLAPIVGVVGAVVQADLIALQDALKTWQANPDASTRAKIEAIIDDLVTKVDAQLLTANGLATTEQQKLALFALSTFATVMHVIDGFLISAQNAKTAKAMAAKRTAKLEQIMPLLNRDILARAAQQNGVTVAQVTNYEQSLGF